MGKATELAACKPHMFPSEGWGRPHKGDSLNRVAYTGALRLLAMWLFHAEFLAGGCCRKPVGLPNPQTTFCASFC